MTDAQRRIDNLDRDQLRIVAARLVGVEVGEVKGVRGVVPESGSTESECVYITTEVGGVVETHMFSQADLKGAI